MYVNSKFTDNREVTHQDYDDYVFSTAAGRAPYGDLSAWEGVDLDEYLTHGNLTDTDGNGTSVGFHTVSGATHQGMESNRLVPAIWHTALNPWVYFKGGMVGGGSIENQGTLDLDTGNEFDVTYYYTIKYTNGMTMTGYTFMDDLECIAGDTVSLDESNSNFSNHYQNSTMISQYEISAITFNRSHVDITGDWETGWTYSIDPTCYLFVKRGNKSKWVQIEEGGTVILAQNGVTQADILGWNLSGQSKYDIEVYFSMEPAITVDMSVPTFNFPWTWRIIYDSTPHPNHGTIQFRLDNSYGNSTYASKSIPTSATTRSVISGVTTMQIPNSYQGQSFIFNWIGAVTGYTSSTAVTNYYLTTGGTMTTLYLNKNPQYVRFTGEIQIQDTIGMYGGGYNSFTVNIYPDGCGDNQRYVDSSEIYDGNFIQIAEYDDSYLIPGSSITITVECNVYTYNQMEVTVTVNENKNVGSASLMHGDSRDMQVMATASNSFRLDGSDIIYIKVNFA